MTIKEKTLACSTILVLAVSVTIMIASFVAPRAAVSEEVDMERIFRCTATDTAGKRRCDEARALILANCTSCHTFVPIVMQQFDRRGWDGLFGRHRGRVPQLSDEQLDGMKAYLASNFNPEQAPPDLPQALIELWTGN